MYDGLLRALSFWNTSLDDYATTDHTTATISTTTIVILCLIYVVFLMFQASHHDFLHAWKVLRP